MPEDRLVERYIRDFETALAAFKVHERNEVVDEIRNHIAEAQAEGKTLDAVFEALGPPESLARAYAVELTLNPRRESKGGAMARISKTVALLAVGSIVTMLVVGALGSVGVGFTASGIAMIAIAGLEAYGVHLPGVQMGGLPPSAVIMLGAAIFIVGIGAIYLLRHYIRLLVRASRRLLPARRVA